MRISDWSSDVCSSDLAALLYQAIDGSGGYYRNPIEPSARSRMNVRFTLHDSALDATFLQGSEAAGLLSLQGHKALGGMRASMYNSVPLAAGEALTALLRDFMQRTGGAGASEIFQARTTGEGRGGKEGVGEGQSWL